MYWYDYEKPNYGKQDKLCSMDMNFYEKMEDIYANLAGEVEKRFDMSNYEAKRPISNTWANER